MSPFSGAFYVAHFEVRGHQKWCIVGRVGDIKVHLRFTDAFSYIYSYLEIDRAQVGLSNIVNVNPHVTASISSVLLSYI